MIPGWTTATRFSRSISRIRPSREGDRQPALDAGRAARQPRAGAARDDRDALFARRAGRARRPRPSWSGSATAPRQAGVEVGRLVVSDTLAVDRRRSAAGGPEAARDRRRQRGAAALAARRRWSRAGVYAAGHRRVGSAAWPAGRGRGTVAPMPGARDAVATAGPRASLAVATRRRAVPPPTAPRPGPGRVPAADGRAIVPGSVGRTSVDLDATYDAYLKLDCGTRAVLGRLDGDDPEHVGRRDRPGRAQHDRRPPRRRCGSDRDRSTGARSTATVSDQTIVVPLGGILPAGATTTVRVSYRATLRSTTCGLRLAVHPGQRDRRPVSLAAVGQPPDRRSTGPNHGDPFVTPSSRARRGPDRRPTGGSSCATTGDRSVGLGRRADPDIRGHATSATSRSPPRTDYRTGVARRSAATTVRVWYRPGRPGAAHARRRRGRVRGAARHGSAPIRTRRSRSSSRPAGTAWNRRA